MSRLIFVLLLMMGTIVSSLAQAEIDNGRWQQIEYEGLNFRLPMAWEEVHRGLWSELETGFDLMLLRSENSQNLEERYVESLDLIHADLTIELISEHHLELAIGDAFALETQNAVGDSHIFLAFNLGSDAVTLIGTTNTETFEEFSETFFQIANTIQSTLPNPDGWLLHADSAARVFVQAPKNWIKVNSSAQLLVLREAFQEVFINISYRDLSQVIELESLEAVFAQAFEETGYSIIAQATKNFPLGNALVFNLNNVVLGQSTHQQIQLLFAYEEILIVVALSANEAYFEEYEGLLLQIADTLYFE